MPKFKIEIKEVLRKTIEIEADSLWEATEIAEEMYNNEEIVLDADDFAYMKMNEVKDE